MTTMHPHTDYRRMVAVALRSGVSSETHIEALLEGFARQAVRQHQRGGPTGEVPAEQVIADALVKGLGYTREAAVSFADDFTLARREYDLIVEAVSGVMDAVDEPDDWDGDEPEAVLLARFIEWLPDATAHRVAEKIRSQAVGGKYAADMVDPFERNSAGQWIRKSDGTPVPWPVVKE